MSGPHAGPPPRDPARALAIEGGPALGRGTIGLVEDPEFPTNFVIRLPCEPPAG